MQRPKVYAIAIEVTAHCQQKCDYCYNAWRGDNGEVKEFQVAVKIGFRLEG